METAGNQKLRLKKALQYNGRKDYLFALKQEWETYKYIQQQIKQTDAEINRLLKQIIEKKRRQKTTLY